MLGGAVEDGRAGTVRCAPGALGQLDCDDLATLAGVAEDLELHQLGVVARRGVELVADAAGLVVRAPDVEAAGGLRGRELADGLATLDPGERAGRRPWRAAVGLRAVEHEVDLASAGAPLVAHVVPLGGQVGDLAGATVAV